MKFHKILLLTVFFILPVFIFSQQTYTGETAQNMIKGAEMIITDNNSVIPLYIKFSDSELIPFDNWEEWIRKNISLPAGNGFKKTSIEKDWLGNQHIRYQQTLGEIPVEGAVYIIHVKNHKVISMNGKLVGSYSPTTATIDESSALNAALAYTACSEYKWQMPEEESRLKKITDDPDATYYPKGELVYVPPSGNFNKKENYVTAYKFDIYAQKPLKREYVFVDAGNGKILFALNRLQTIDSLGTAYTKYSGPQIFTTDFYGGIFRLRETGRGNGIETYNMQQGTSTGSAVDFTDPDNDWNNINAQWDEAATDAHWATESTYDFFHDLFNRNSIDDLGFKLVSYVHYSSGYVNAFWDGTCMTYGDGDGSTYFPLTTVDICAHEISHGLTENTAGLIYSDESGGINEGYSDAFGTSIEFFAKPTDANWMMGEDMGPPFRDMHDPNPYGCPDTYYGINFDSLYLEVHNTSGVFNYWFYLVTDGEIGVNDKGNAYNVTGIGMGKADSIAYRALTAYMTPSTTYLEARTYTQIAATDLYGACSIEVEAVADAWYAVNVGGLYSNLVICDFSAPTTMYCTDTASVTFNNMSLNSNNFLWDFGDGTTSTLANPTHHYAIEGLFDVKLIAYGGGPCGADDSLTKTAYINIDTENPCIYTMPQTGTALYTTCNGTLYDSGGPQNYQDDTDVNITISPPGAISISLQFAMFDFELNWDYLYIYDGPTTASPLIGQYTGNTLPNGGTIVSTGPSITLRQFTDEYVNNPGFEVNWSCAVGLNETGENSENIQLYPNPTSGKFEVKSDKLNVKSIDIFNVLGEKVFSRYLNNKQTSFGIDLSDNADGVYFVKMYTDKEIIVRKITKE